MQEDLALITTKHEQVSGSEAQARQQLAVATQQCEQATAAAAGAEHEVQRLSMALHGSEAQLAEALQKESQVRPNATSASSSGGKYCQQACK